MKRTGGAAPQGRFLELKCDRRGIHALVSLFASMPLPSALSSRWQRVFGVCVLCWRVASAGIKHEGVAVFEGDFDRLAGGGARVEPVGLFGFVIVRNPLADGLLGRRTSPRSAHPPPRSLAMKTQIRSGPLPATQRRHRPSGQWRTFS